MRLGIVSDIHCNYPGLQKALELMGDIDRLVCAGDAVFQFRWSNEVVGCLRDLDALVVQGNHEETLLAPDSRALEDPAVDQELVSWMRAQPFRIETEVGGKRLLLTHGSPWEPWRDYVYPHHKRIWSKASDMGFDCIIVGHTHFKMAERYGQALIINPGSAGDARDPSNEFQLSCAVWDTESGDVTFYDYPDPLRAYINLNAASEAGA
ncbi:MAG TPA: metallophosphoesterase family protein [Tepidiformaceae bacterium]|nr:metallophosphoesterase family protein [Tepidiformaceae bacterium]